MCCISIAARGRYCATDFTVQLTLQDEALKEVQKDLQVQKERSEMFMSFVDEETNKVDIRKVLQELEQLQQRISDRDVDRVVDSVLNVVLNNDSTEMERPPSGQEVTNPRRFGLALLGGTSENLLESDSLLLPNFPTQDYTPHSEVAEVAVPAPHLQELFATILNQPTQPPCAAMSGRSVFDMMEDLPTTDITTK
jgi:hypothetical protein